MIEIERDANVNLHMLNLKGGMLFTFIEYKLNQAKSIIEH